MSRGFFFRADGADLVPLPVARSYWGQTLHGRLIGGLVARAAQGDCADDAGLTCARLTVDMFRTAQLAPVQVVSHRVRDGRRIRVIDVTVTQAGEAIGQGKVVMLRRGDQPDGEFPGMPAWNPTAVAELGPPAQAAPGAQWTAPWESWPVVAADGRRDGVWLRETMDLVEGEAISPLVRLALHSDLASPMVNTSTAGLGFINADYTVYMHRDPVGEHIGIQPLGHASGAGIAVGQCAVHDANGPIGFIGMAAVATAPVR